MFAFTLGPLILVVAGWALYIGVSHALRPLERKLATLRLLSLTSIFAIVGAAAAGLANTLMQVVDGPPEMNLAAMARITAGGISETALAPMVGFSLLAVAWLAATFGVRKQI